MLAIVGYLGQSQSYFVLDTFFWTPYGEQYTL